jgi:transposase
MLVISCDFHTRYQQIAMMEQSEGVTTGEIIERRLEHATGDADAFYRGLREKMIVGIEATGPIQWFQRVLAQLGHELWVGDAAQIRACAVRKQKTDPRDARLILDLCVPANRPSAPTRQKPYAFVTCFSSPAGNATHQVVSPCNRATPTTAPCSIGSIHAI